MNGPTERSSERGESRFPFVRRAGGWLSLIWTSLLIFLPLVLFIYTEIQTHRKHEALTEVYNAKIVNLPAVTIPGDIVHGSSDSIKATVKDPGLGVTIDHALVLDRKTEFCQWNEIQSTSCNTCSREVRNNDGTTETENYDCDCVVQYSYIKTWTPRLINSYFFDQPAAHYNPQRNPLPSDLFVAHDAILSFKNSPKGASTTAKLLPDLLRSRVKGATKRKVMWVRDGIPPIPPFWKRWIPDRSRYENTSTLKRPRSGPAEHGNFVYVGNGYFFSPHSSSTLEKMMKLFGQYVEGSLLDFQFGDIMPSCTAGDIRISYTIQDPNTVSVLGQVDGEARGSELNLKNIKTENGLDVGMVHAGTLSAHQIIEKELSDSQMAAIIFRLISIVWAFFTCRSGGYIIGYDTRKSSIMNQAILTMAIWTFLTGLMWSRIWGPSLAAHFVTSLSIVLLTIVYLQPPSRVKGRLTMNNNSAQRFTEMITAYFKMSPGNLA